LSDLQFDLVVIGGGPGGYTAAIRASQLGMRTALVERDELGGVCLNWGCIPTKALLRASELYESLRDLEAWGLNAASVTFDTAKLVERSRKAAAQLSAGVAHLMRKNGVTVLRGEAKLGGSARIEITSGVGAVDELRAAHVILATGACARSLPALDPGRDLVWSYREAMVPQAIPESILVVGAGAIGVEFASFYRAMGAEVTLIEVLPQILPAEDDEIAAFVRRQFERRGIRVLTSTTVLGLERQRGRVAASLDPGSRLETVTAERVICAAGVQGNVEGLGLEGTAVRVERGFVAVDQWLRTGEPGVYAIGDVAGPPCLAHKAAHEAVVCVEHIAGFEGVRPLNRLRVPACTYSQPQVASAGLTEKAAREAGIEVRVGRFPFSANGKAVALGETRGMVKTLFDSATGELVGAHMAGPEVTELIHGFVLAMNLEATEESLMHTVYPHPTLSEAMHESVLAAYGRALNI
jgi:dihydrolipoamide dehydrogenase